MRKVYAIHKKGSYIFAFIFLAFVSENEILSFVYRVWKLKRLMSLLVMHFLMRQDER